MEVIPGVVCQFRLNSAGTIRDVDHSGAVVEASVSNVETDLLYKFVSEFMKVADKSRLDLGGAAFKKSEDSVSKAKRSNLKGGRK